MQKYELKLHFLSPKVPQYLFSKIPKHYRLFFFLIFDTKYIGLDRDSSKPHYTLVNVAHNLLQLFLTRCDALCHIPTPHPKLYFYFVSALNKSAFSRINLDFFGFNYWVVVFHLFIFGL